MVRTPILVVGALTVLAMAVLAGPVRADLIVNGSFEAGFPADIENAYTPLGPGATNITGWTVGSTGGIDWVRSWQASDGIRSLDLNGQEPGSIFQSFATTPGTAYRVRFDLAGNPEGSPSLKSMTVDATGNLSETYLFDITGQTQSNMGWRPFEYTFVATSSTTTLTFASTTGGSFPAFGPALDNVRVFALTPEPLSLASFGLAIAGLVGYRRRQAKV